VQAATSSGFGGTVLSSSTLLTTGTAAGLTPNTSYYLRVGVSGSYGVTLATVTLANPPLSAAFASVYASSATLQWNANSDPADTAFQVDLATAANFTGTLISSTTLNSQAYFPALAAGTTYYARVRAVNRAGTPTAYATAGPSVTSVNPARPPLLAGIADRLMNSGTTLQIVISTSDPDNDPVALSVAVASPSTISASIAGATLSLTAASTYYTVFPIRVTVSATDGVFTTTTSFNVRVRPGPTVVPPYPLPPQTSGADFNTDGTVAIAWEKSGSNLLMDGLVLHGHYEIYTNNGDGSEPTILYATIPSDGRQFYLVITSTLPACTDFRFLIRTVDPWGVADAYPTYITARNLCTGVSIADAPIVMPTSGDRIWQQGGSMVVAKLKGTDAVIARVVSVRLQYRAPSSTTTWTSFPEDAVRDGLGLYRSFWNPPSTGTFELRGLVTDIAAQSDEGTATGIGVEVVASSASILSGTIVSPGSIQTMKALVCGAPVTVYSESPAGNPEPTTAQTDLDACAFAAATDIADIRLVETIRLRAPEDADIPSGKAPVGHNVKVEVIDFINNTSLHDLDNGKYAYVTLTYQDANGDGVVDGTEVLENTLEMWHNHLGTWSRVTEASGDLTWTRARGGRSGVMRVRTNKFSEFRMVGAGVSPDLSNVGIYPNPFIPNDGDPDNGVPYTGAVNTGITFVNLPGVVAIKIYTVTGAMVADFSADNSSGRSLWDAKNKDGRDAASGGYLAVLTSPGHGRAVRKFLVIR